MTPDIGRLSAGLSLDLDNLWSYLRSHGDERWTEYPSFLHLAVPRILETFSTLDLHATIFVVGRDAANPAHANLIHELVDAGHEIANHSFEHHPNFSQFEGRRLEQDFDDSEAALRDYVPCDRLGFRAPDFSLSAASITQLSLRDYRYDSSLLPTSLGPLARLWKRLNVDAKRKTDDGFMASYGSRKGAGAPQKPFQWHDEQSRIIELPVTTMPYTRFPVHWTYLNFIADLSHGLARAYLDTHLGLLRYEKLQPQLLLHCTDFLGSDDPLVPQFVPGMKRNAKDKVAFLKATLAMYQNRYRLIPLGRFVEKEIEEAGSIERSPATFFDNT